MLRTLALRLWLFSALCAAGAAAQATPGPSAIQTESKGAEIKIHDTTVLKLWVDRPQQTAQARAFTASRALEHALDSRASEIRIDTHGDVRVLFAGDYPVIELYEADAGAAGSPSLDVYAATVAAQLNRGLASERRRSDIAGTVFSISLVVSFGFIALYILRKLGELADRARNVVAEHPERIAGIRLRSVRVIGAEPLRAIVLGLVIVGRWVLQLGVVYIWLVLSLSRFEGTRQYTQKLNHSLIDPLYALAQRSLGAVPILVLGFALTAAVIVAVRFIELYFMGVSRGHQRVSWLPRDLVGPASALIRVAIVALALILAGPIVSDDPQGVLARLGSGVLFALALAATPLLCAIGWGAVLVLTRRVQLGELVSIGPYHGRVLRVGMLDLQLRAADDSELRVPHLRSLVTPIRILSSERRRSVELCVSSAVEPNAVIELFTLALRSAGGVEDVQIDLLHVDADGARYQASVPGRDARSASELLVSLTRAMQRENIPFGRSAPAGRGHG